MDVNIGSGDWGFITSNGEIGRIDFSINNQSGFTYVTWSPFLKLMTMPGILLQLLEMIFNRF